MSKIIFLCVKCANKKIQIHEYTNTVFDEVPERPNTCYIFEKIPKITGSSVSVEICGNPDPNANQLNWAMNIHLTPLHALNSQELHAIYIEIKRKLQK